jgi:hypothetical protein
MNGSVVAFVYLVQRGADQPPFRPSVEKYLEVKEQSISSQVRVHMRSDQFRGKGTDLIEMLVLPISKGKHRKAEIAQPLTLVILLKSNQAKANMNIRRKHTQVHWEH